jgi:hypothetical protein
MEEEKDNKNPYLGNAGLIRDQRYRTDPECRCRTEAVEYRKKCRCHTNFFSDVPVSWHYL